MKRVLIVLSAMALSAFADPITYNWTATSASGNFSDASWDSTPDLTSGLGIYKFNNINIGAARTYAVDTTVNAYGLYLGALNGGSTATVGGSSELHLGAGGLTLANWTLLVGVGSDLHRCGSDMDAFRQ